MLLTVPAGSKGYFPKGKVYRREGKDTRLAKQRMTTKIPLLFLKHVQLFSDLEELFI